MKTIITVQHTESVHHTNGHAGACGNWPLTELGRKQAFKIGEWLLREGCNEGYVMYCSDLDRAAQTAEEINRSLPLTPVFSEIIREVNAGEGNGKPWEWFDAHKIPCDGYSVDYKPFADGESDRELWNRLLPFYKSIMESHDERILIVSHGTAISFLQSMLMGYSLEDIERFRFRGRSGSVSKFTVEDSGKVVADLINMRIY